jgi:uncharacterized protein (DUF736 family)
MRADGRYKGHLRTVLTRAVIEVVLIAKKSSET